MSNGVKNVGDEKNFTPFGKGKSTNADAQGGSDGAMGMKGQSAGGLKPITQVTLAGGGSGDVKNVGSPKFPFKPKM